MEYRNIRAVELMRVAAGVPGNTKLSIRSDTGIPNTNLRSVFFEDIRRVYSKGDNKNRVDYIALHANERDFDQWYESKTDGARLDVSAQEVLDAVRGVDTAVEVRLVSDTGVARGDGAVIIENASFDQNANVITLTVNDRPSFSVE